MNLEQLNEIIEHNLAVAPHLQATSRRTIILDILLVLAVVLLPLAVCLYMGYATLGISVLESTRIPSRHRLWVLLLDKIQRLDGITSLWYRLLVGSLETSQSTPEVQQLLLRGCWIARFLVLEQHQIITSWML